MGAYRERSATLAAGDVKSKTPVVRYRRGFYFLQLPLSRKNVNQILAQISKCGQGAMQRWHNDMSSLGKPTLKE